MTIKVITTSVKKSEYFKGSFSYEIELWEKNQSSNKNETQVDFCGARIQMTLFEKNSIKVGDEFTLELK